MKALLQACVLEQAYQETGGGMCRVRWWTGVADHAFSQLTVAELFEGIEPYRIK